MKEFFKMVFASMLGMILSFFVIFILMIVIVAAIIASLEDNKVKVSANSVIHMSLDHEIRERSSKNPFEKLDFGGFESNKSIGLNDIIASIKRAKNDDFRCIFWGRHYL